MVNQFCRYLSNGFRAESNGINLTYSPCCWFKTKVDMLDSKFEKERERISQIKSWTPECGACRTIEQSGVYGERSPRAMASAHVPDDSVPNYEPVRLEITIDTTCNAACLICGPWHSTTWEKQQLKFRIRDLTHIPTRVDPNIWLDKFTSMYSFKYVNSISFLGGEPFKSEIPVKFLQFIKKVKPLTDIRLHFQTNGSIQPSPQLIELINESNRVIYNYSLDGINAQAEYLRYPLRWKKILNTLEYIQNNDVNNAVHTVLATMTPLNLLRYNEVDQWATEFFSDSYRPPNSFILRPNRAIGNMDLAFTPIALRTDAVNFYGDNHPVSKMLSNLEVYHDPTKFLSYLNLWDQNRKTNWREIFPEIVKYFE